MEWENATRDFMSSQEMTSIKQKVKVERKSKSIYPDASNTLRALKLCPLDKVRVVIFGNSPYSTEGTADGLAFSTSQSETPAPLQAIFKEVYRDLQVKLVQGLDIHEYFETNSLVNWTAAGFLLLNTTLTVEKDKDNSHTNIGWMDFSKEIIKIINTYSKRRVIFLLWGNKAQTFAPLIDQGPHIYFTSSEPGGVEFNKCGHFSIVRDIICSWMSKTNPNSEFNIEEVKGVIKETYPNSTERLNHYIDKGIIFGSGFNGDAFRLNMRKFENLLSSKI